MSKLANIQEQILESLISTKMDDLDFIKTTGNVSNTERLLVHRYTILENFVNRLKINYPGIWKLLGENCARGAALAYSHKLTNITSRGEVNKFGANFAVHLESFPSTLELTYLPDFARLEWLRSVSAEAKNEITIAPDKLAKMNPDKLEKYQLIFNSSVFFMKSTFPLMQIQDLINDKNSSEIMLSRESSYFIVYRLDNIVNTAWLAQDTWEFLFSLHNGKSLGEALYESQKMGFELNLEEIFKFIFLRKMIAQIK
jgi:hypothetical protein